MLYDRLHSRRSAAGSLLLLALAPALLANARKTEALKIFRNRLFVRASVNGVSVEALLDSAAEISFADKIFARRIGLASGDAVQAQGSGASSQDAEIVNAVRIEAVGVTLPQTPIAVLDLADVSARLIGRRLDFILGRDFFDAARLAINIRQRAIAQLDKNDRPSGQRFPLTTEFGTETMIVQIEGKDAHAAIDLGNGSLPLLGKVYAKRVGIIDDGRPTGKQKGGGIGGEIERQTLELKQLQIGNRLFRNIRVAIDEKQNASDFNVGTSLLKHFGIVTDFANHQIWLR